MLYLSPHSFRLPGMFESTDEKKSVGRMRERMTIAVKSIHRHVLFFIRSMIIEKKMKSSIENWLFIFTSIDDEEKERISHFFFLRFFCSVVFFFIREKKQNTSLSIIEIIL